MNKQAFWDEQAQRGSLSGTRDRYAKELEMQTIARYVKDGMRVLDVGCGDGETLKYLAHKFNIYGVGTDYSEKMIIEAKKKYDGNLWFKCSDIREIKNSDFPGFDLIYTQRALINLDTWGEQKQAILDILSLLKPGGTYVMVECFTEGLDEINQLREKVGLPEIKMPWHNRYLGEEELVDFLHNKFELESYRRIYFSGAYYLMSRVVNAWWAKNFGGEPEYDSSLNFLGTLLPPDCVNLRGQTQAWIIKKKEG